MKTHKTFFDEELRLDQLTAKRDPLLKLNEKINWNIFRTILNNAFRNVPEGPGGRPRFDLIMMFKILILQRLYNLSDEQTEYQLIDRLSFSRFIGIELKDKVPDQNTIWLFRETLVQKGKIRQLFNKFTHHLKSLGLMANEGSIVDASFIEVPIQRNTKEENKNIKQGGIPEDWSDKKKSHKDTDARWMKKSGSKHYGYKNHIKIGAKSKFIKTYATTSANVHDSQVVTELLDKEDKGHLFFADSAYASKEITRELDHRGIFKRINEKGYRDHPLTKMQKKKNRRKSSVRVFVEHVFGFMENSMKGMYLRYIGQKRIDGVIGLMNLTYNLMKAPA